MGQGYEYRCRKCGKGISVLTGVGFLFPITYAELMEKGRAGELGKEIQEFLNDHADGALNAEEAAYQCKKCGNVISEPILTMYLPKDPEKIKTKHKGRWSIAVPAEDMDYVSPGDLKEDYKVYKIYPHYCGKCGSRMRKLTDKELEAGLNCPVCGEAMESGIIMWD